MTSQNPAQNPGGGRTPANQPERGDKDSKPSENQPSHQGNRPDSAQQPSQPDREGGGSQSGGQGGGRNQ